MYLVCLVLLFVHAILYSGVKFLHWWKKLDFYKYYFFNYIDKLLITHIIIILFCLLKNMCISISILHRFKRNCSIDSWLKNITRKIGLARNCSKDLGQRLWHTMRPSRWTVTNAFVVFIQFYVERCLCKHCCCASIQKTIYTHTDTCRHLHVYDISRFNIAYWLRDNAVSLEVNQYIILYYY